MTPRYGLTTLSPKDYPKLPDKASIKVDIVLVHGLNGDSLATWTATTTKPPCCWPQDILPGLCPEARIMTFGYNANLFKDTIQGRIAEFAENLLADLNAERFHDVTEQQRPIIFVCHSMGGIVVKRMLSLAHGRPEYRPLFDATHSIIFMATPHRGSDKATYADLAERMLKCGKLFTAEPTKAAQELQLFSAVLEDYNTNFVDISEKIRIISFYEKKPYGPVGLIVQEWSALMGSRNEIAKKAVSANHQDICRFTSEESQDFQTFWSQLRMLKRMATQGGSHRVGETSLAAVTSPTDLAAGSDVFQKRSTKRQLDSDEHSFDVVKSEDLTIRKKAQLSSEPTFLWRVPHFTPHRYFERHEALDKLKRALIDEGHRSFGIHGLGGVGKTQLAHKYIHTYSYMYSHVFWVLADTDLKLKTSYREMALELGKIDESVSDLEKARLAMQGWFNENQNWLLILDNVEVTSKIFKEYLPSSQKGFLIVTSRTPSLVEQHVLIDGLRLRPFGEAEGAEFFLSQDMALEDSQRNWQLAEDISKELGGHPLALSAMAGYIKSTQISLDDFLQEFRQNREVYMSTNLDDTLQDASFDYEKSLSTCWTISFGPLYGKPAGELLGILALLDPDTITEDILTNYAQDICKSSVPSLQNLPSYRASYAHLWKYALISKEPPITASASGQSLISIHRLVQQAWLSSQESQASLWQIFDYATNCLSSIYPRQVNGESMQQDFPQCRALTPHIMSLHSHYMQFFAPSDNKQSKEYPQETKLFVQLLADAGWFLYETNQWETAMMLFSTGEKLCLIYFNDAPHKLTALIYNNIGVIHNSMYNPEESMKYAKMSLAIREKCLSEDDPEMGNSYANVGHTLVDTGRYREAQVYYTRAVEVHERAKVPSSDLLEGAYTCMGMCMLFLNQLTEAESWLDKAINQHQYFDSPNFFVGFTLFIKGSLRMKQNRWEAAEDLVQKSLELSIEVKGPNARFVGVCQHHLAFIRHQLGYKEEAIALLRKAIAVFRVPSETQLGLLQRSQLKLASILDELGDKEAYEIRNEVRDHCLRDPSLRNIPLDNEKEWNNIVQVVYRCV